MTPHQKKKGGTGDNVKVVVRCRPMNQLEKDRKEIPIVMVNQDIAQISVYKTNEDQTNLSNDPPRNFTFDHAYGPATQQEGFFNTCAKPIVNDVLEGFNGTIFAYGQTGTGKTYSMEGVRHDPAQKGVMPRSFEHIFDQVAMAPKDVEYLVRASFLEIYLDNIYDLLNKKTRKKMEIKESPEKGVFVKGLHEFVVKEPEDMMKLLTVGSKSRATGATKMNPGSSRSHSLLCITIEASETDEKGVAHYRVGRLNLVDLAGSERQKRTGAEGVRLEEGKAINQSLAALGNVIKALVSDKPIHIPYRDSKLTRLLQDSLGGNAKTVMIAAIGPACLSYDETLTTLRYADRAKSIKNKAKRNEDPKDARLREMKEEIEALKARLNNMGVTPNLVKDPVTGEMIPEQETITEEKIIEKVVVIEGELNEEELKKFHQKSSEEQKAIAKAMIKEKQQALRSQKQVELLAKRTEEQLKKTEEQLEKERKDIEDIQRMIQERETQFLVGSDKVTQAQLEKQELEKTERLIQEQKEEEARLKAELEEANEAKLYINEQYSNRTDELRGKTKMLKQLWSKFSEKKAELQEIQSEWDLEQEDLLDAIRGLDHQIRLKQVILDSFIPLRYQQLIENQAHYDSYNDEWSISGLEHTINNMHLQKNNVGGRMPDVDYARQEPSMQRALSYVSHLIPQTLNRYGQPEVPLEIQDAISTALHTNEPIGITSPPSNVYYKYGIQEKGKKSRRKKK